MKRYFVLGGASGIGQATVEELVRQGHEVVATYNRSSEAAEEIAKACGGQVKFLQYDLSRLDAVAEMSDHIINEEDVFDGAVLCAARSYDQLVPLLDGARISETLMTNVTATIQCVSALGRRMLRNRSGSIVIISSIAAVRGNKGNAVYAASKGAIEAFVKSASQEFGVRNVSINALAPGFVDTRMIQKYGQHVEDMKKQIPGKRFAQPEEVARVAVTLMSDAFAYMNGATVTLDGGVSAGLNLR